MVSRNLKDWFVTLAVLVVVPLMGWAITGIPMDDQHKSATNTISPRAEPQIFATTINGSLTSIEESTIGVSMTGSFFVVYHAGGPLFFVNNVKSDSGIIVETENRDGDRMVMPLGEALSFFGSESTNGNYSFVVRVRHPEYTMTCVIESPGKRPSYGMMIYCS